MRISTRAAITIPATSPPFRQVSGKKKKKEEKNYKKSVMFEAEKEKSRMILHHPIYLNGEQKEQYQELTMFPA